MSGKVWAKSCRLGLRNATEVYNGHMQAMMKELDELERLAGIGRDVESGVDITWDEEDMFCGKCGNYVYDDENYCKECGVKILVHGRDIP